MEGKTNVYFTRLLNKREGIDDLIIVIGRLKVCSQEFYLPK
jgi:hypothetical protein